MFANDMFTYVVKQPIQHGNSTLACSDENAVHNLLASAQCLCDNEAARARLTTKNSVASTKKKEKEKATPLGIMIGAPEQRQPQYITTYVIFRCASNEVCFVQPHIAAWHAAAAYTYNAELHVHHFHSRTLMCSARSRERKTPKHL